MSIALTLLADSWRYWFTGCLLATGFAVCGEARAQIDPPADDAREQAASAPPRDDALESKKLATVVLQQRGPVSPLLAEALVRARAELRAAGLVVVVPETEEDSLPALWSADPDVHGRLVFEQFGATVRIEALAPGLNAPVVQTVDSSEPSVDAEVVAVRAVETLRAAMVRYVRLANDSRQALPDALGRFTKVQPRRSKRTVNPPKRRGVRKETSARATNTAIRLNLWLAPEIYVDIRAGETSSGGRVVFYGGRDWFHLGVSLHQTWALHPVVRDEGQATTWRTDAGLVLKIQGDVGPNTTLFAAVGGGYRQYVVEADAAPGFIAWDRQHLSPSGSFEIGAAQWMGREWGLFLDCGATVAADAPELYFAGESVARLDRPSIWVSLGVIAGQR